MSKPRYDWWPYVKGMIRRYPELCAREAELRSTPASPNLSGMPRGKGRAGDPTAAAALRRLPEINQRELEAVRSAVRQTEALPNGAKRMELVRMVFWRCTYTVWGASVRLEISERTAQEWHREFIRRVAKNFGLIDEIAS